MVKERNAMQEQELRYEYEQRLQNWRDAEDAYNEGGTEQQRKDMEAAEAAHDKAAKALVNAGYSLEVK